MGLDIGSTFNGGSSIDQLLNIFYSGGLQTWGSFGSGNQVGLCCNAAGQTYLGSIAMRVYGNEIEAKVLHLEFDDGVNPTADSSGNGNDGTLTPSKASLGLIFVTLRAAVP